ncbi:hypothetical protein [Aquimarina sp. RZ0]|uniref:hypothetical protein n=1 Tax=Aquimarina sp. RZ0 TaxID=2607730 RepID=UPI0011F32AB3|nr:hypothetical protein [Aquimarina sp. RZ0]KAA1247070.1 hypothetical protein F0000_05130 [Aquimarina sp. RZ0]
MEKEKLAYRLLYITGGMVVLTSIFMQQWVLYTKPLVIVSLSILYLVKTKKVQYLVLFTMLLIMIAEILTMKDFIGYFREINSILIVYYCLNMILLWKSLQTIKIQLEKVFTVQMIIAMGLIIYIIYEVADIILPSINENQLYLNLLIVCFISFIGCCYYIYLNSKTIISSSLVVAASCFFIVNIIIALNKLYIYLEIFVLISNVLQIFGQFFLIKFFIEQDDLILENDEYF